MLLRQFFTRRNRCDRNQGGTLMRAITCFILSWWSLSRLSLSPLTILSAGEKGGRYSSVRPLHYSDVNKTLITTLTSYNTFL